jgi:hypothetical protein
MEIAKRVHTVYFFGRSFRMRLSRLSQRAGLVCSMMLVGAAVAQARSFTVDSIILRDPDEGGTLGENELSEFFNRARCRCKTLVPVEFRLSFQDGGESRPVTVVAGQGDCLDADNNIDTRTCSEPEGEFPSEMENQFGDIETNFAANELMATDTCDDVGEDEITLSVFVDQDGTWQRLGEPGATYTRDVDPPSAPQLASDASEREPQAGDGRLTVRFEVASDSKTDTKHYQLLCVEMSSDGTEVIGPWSEQVQTAAFISAQGLCGATDADADGQSAENVGDGQSAVDAGAGADVGAEATTGSTSEPPRPANLLSYRENPYVCSRRLSSAGAISIAGLQNGTRYGVWVVAIDQAQNPSEPRWIGSGVPSSVEDLWERYSRLGGKADGGYGCSIPAQAPAIAWGLAALVLIGLLGASISRRGRQAQGREQRGQR